MLRKIGISLVTRKKKWLTNTSCSWSLLNSTLVELTHETFGEMIDELTFVKVWWQLVRSKSFSDE